VHVCEEYTKKFVEYIFFYWLCIYLKMRDKLLYRGNENIGNINYNQTPTKNVSKRKFEIFAPSPLSPKSPWSENKPWMDAVLDANWSLLEGRVLEHLDSQCGFNTKINSGAQGNVYKVRFRGEYRALKKTKYSMYGTGENEFQQEVCILSHLTQQQQDTPYLIRVVGAGSDTSSGYLVMELATESFNEFVTHANEDELDKAFQRIEEALQFLKQHKVIHRDIKPGNILMVDGTPVLADFGIALQAETSCEQVGTTMFMSPKSVYGKQYGYEKDSWALGLMMLQLARCNDDTSSRLPHFEEDGRFECKSSAGLMSLISWFKHILASKGKVFTPEPHMSKTTQELLIKSRMICYPQIEEIESCLSDNCSDDKECYQGFRAGSSSGSHKRPRSPEFEDKGLTALHELKMLPPDASHEEKMNAMHKAYSNK